MASRQSSSTWRSSAFQAAASRLDKAMTLGLNYPLWPLALADHLGPAVVHSILGQLQAITGDDRYRPSLWLRRRAQLGLSALTEA